MCCRYLLLRQQFHELLERLGIDAAPEFASRFNIAPGSLLPAVRAQPGKTKPAREAVALRWGLVPAWTKSAAPAGLANARAESLAAKPSFRDAARTRRCVLPASGFYEWEHRGRARRPWLFRRRDESPFGLAGVWETWRAPDGSQRETCAVVTTEPNDLLRPIHHRMPVMLDPAACAAWLDPRTTDLAQLAPLLRPPPPDTMTARALDPRVNDLRHDDAACLAPAAPNEPGGGPQLSLGF